MFILCDILVPFEIEVTRKLDEQHTKEIAGLAAFFVAKNKVDLITVYPYLGEIEVYYDEESFLPLSEGTYLTISLELEYDENWRNKESVILDLILLELQKEDLYISNHSHKHIAFIKDYD